MIEWKKRRDTRVEEIEKREWKIERERESVCVCMYVTVKEKERVCVEENEKA